MARDEWYRHSTWSAADQEDFFARLKRSRTPANKAQYLGIQASYLADAGHCDAAARLLDQLLHDFPQHLLLAQTHLQKALCLIELNQPEAAINEFRASLQAERERPNVCTNCWLQFPWFIVRQKNAALYDEAAAILDEFKTDSNLTFPMQRYQYAAVRALIAEARGDRDTASEFASLALQCAALKHSGFRRHPDVGLVNMVDAEMHGRLAALAGATE